MNYRLGLDLGTNSIGWAVINNSDPRNPELVDTGVRVFSDGREPASNERIGDSLAVKRRMARLMRRQRDRRRRRIHRLASFLSRNGYLPKKRAERKRWLHSLPDSEKTLEIEPRRLARRVFEAVFSIIGYPSFLKRSEVDRIHHLDPYKLRAEALDRVLEPYELGRVLMHISRRRGFKSNRKADATSDDDKDLSVTKQKMRNLDEAIAEADARTLGELLWLRHKAGDSVRFRPEAGQFYPRRDHYEDEFEQIRNAQQKHHPDLDWDKVREIIFYQRPLKPVERGRCRYYPDQPRAHRAVPSVQKYRIRQEVNSLAYTDHRGAVVTLDKSQKERLYTTLEHQKTLSFDKIRKILEKDVRFNLESARRTSLKGNETACELRRKERFGDTWDTLDWELQDEVVTALIESETDDAAEESIRALVSELNEESLKSIVTYHPPRATAAVSLRFARECAQVMEKESLQYYEAVERLGFLHYDEAPESDYEQLPYYGKILSQSTLGSDPSAPEDEPERKYGKIPNPTVHVSLNQLKRIVNALIERYGRPTEISIELGRRLKQNQKQVSETITINRRNERERQRRITEMSELGITNPSRDDVLRYELWEELGTGSTTRRCVYCGGNISARELFDGSVEIEHILPFSRTLIDAKSNKTVVHKSCNNQKGNKTPAEAFTGDEYTAVLARANEAFKYNARKRKRFRIDAMAEADDVGTFLQRQATDNAYIARAAKRYLSAVCPANDIWPTTGMLTARARRQWGLDSILMKPHAIKNGELKNRLDHRHHALDAITVGILTRSIIQDAATRSSRNDKFELPPCPLSRDAITTALSRILVSYRPDRSISGRIFEETAYSKREVPERTNLLGLTWGGNTPWVTRKDISALKPREAREAIIDPVVEKAVQTYCRWTIENGNEKQLTEELTEFRRQTGIKRTRIRSYSQGSQVFIPSAPHKAYDSDGLAYCEIWKVPTKKTHKFVGEFWNRRDAYQRNRRRSEIPNGAVRAEDMDRKPHPAAKKLMRVYKDDVLRITVPDHGSVYARVAGFHGPANKLDLLPLYTADKAADWFGQTQQNLVDWPLSLRNGQNYLAINSLFKYEVKRCSITPDGREL